VNVTDFPLYDFSTIVSTDATSELTVVLNNNMNYSLIAQSSCYDASEFDYY
jgi:hypothetical protein